MSSFGLSQDQIDFLVKIFETHFHNATQATVWVFGSRAKGTHRTYRDLDLLVQSEPALSEEQVSALKVDLV